MSYKTTLTSFSVHTTEDNPVFGNSAIHVKIEDDAAGPYLVLHQCSDENEGQITIDFDQFDEIAKSIELLRQKNV